VNARLGVKQVRPGPTTVSTLRMLLAPSPRMGPMDVGLAALVTALIGFGVVMVYSASAVEATVVFRDPQYFLKRQVLYGAAAVVSMLAISRVDYHKLRPFTYPLLGLVTFLMVLSVIGFGHTGGGAARWLRVGGIQIQPSEAAKIALVLWLAYSLAKKQEQVKSFSVGMLPHLLMAGGLMLLCLKQPDFGGAAVLLFLTFTLLFAAGARLGYLLGLAIAALGVAAYLVNSADYRKARWLAWLQMDVHRQDLAFQPFQSVMSFGSGQLTGLGLGNGYQVLYLPEAHTDFVAAIVGEELGFVAILGLCVVYVVIVARGVRAALTADDEYGAYIAFGIAALFGVQALVNLAVAMAVLPTKGLTLPFVSYGGSSLVTSSLAMGILLNVSRPRVTGNTRSSTQGADQPEASAFVVSEAGFAPPSAANAASSRHARALRDDAALGGAT
jgi:cell division protein FtsW